MYQSDPKGLADGNVGERPINPDSKNRLLRPNKEELYSEILLQTRHCSVVELYKPHLKCGLKDTQAPHDLMGRGNKLEPEVIRYLALQHRDSRGLCDAIQIGVKNHIEYQEHHTNVNGFELARGATVDFIRYGMLDAVCAIRQNRPYAVKNGEIAIGFKEAYDIFTHGKVVQPIHKIFYFGDVLDDMIRLEEKAEQNNEKVKGENPGVKWPALELITMEDILGQGLMPNRFRLEQSVHQAIEKRVKWAVHMVKTGGYERAWDQMDAGTFVPNWVAL